MDIVSASPERDQRRDGSQKLAGVGHTREPWSQAAAPTSPGAHVLPRDGCWEGWKWPGPSLVKFGRLRGAGSGGARCGTESSGLSGAKEALLCRAALQCLGGAEDSYNLPKSCKYP